MRGWKRWRGFKRFIFSGLLGLILALVSVNYETYAIVKIGTECVTPSNPRGWCYGPVPQGGWPLPYLQDSPHLSPVGSIGLLGEDIWLFEAWVADVLFYTAAVFIVGSWWVSQKK